MENLGNKERQEKEGKRPFGDDIVPFSDEAVKGHPPSSRRHKSRESGIIKRTVTKDKNKGIGMTVSHDERTGLLKVEEVDMGSPADKAGFNVSDYIINVNGVSTASQKDIFKLLPSESDTFIMMVVPGNIMKTVALGGASKNKKARLANSTERKTKKRVTDKFLLNGRKDSPRRRPKKVRKTKKRKLHKGRIPHKKSRKKRR